MALYEMNLAALFLLLAIIITSINVDLLRLVTLAGLDEELSHKLKGVVGVFAELGTSLLESDVVAGRKILKLLLGDNARAFEVCLVRENNNLNIGRLVIHKLDPVAKTFEGFFRSDVADEERTLRIAGVEPDERTVNFLASRVPEFKRDLALVDFQGESDELRADGRDVSFRKNAFGNTRHKRSLADARVAEHANLIVRFFSHSDCF